MFKFLYFSSKFGKDGDGKEARLNRMMFISSG